MTLVQQQYLNAILRQVNVKKALLADKGVSACKIYMSGTTYCNIALIDLNLFDDNQGERRFEGLRVIIAHIEDDIIDVGVDFSGLTY